jgi:hypothetical protein
MHRLCNALRFRANKGKPDEFPTLSPIALRWQIRWKLASTRGGSATRT